MISNLQNKVMESLKNEIGLVTKRLIGKIEALEGKMEIYEAHLRELQKREKELWK